MPTMVEQSSRLLALPKELRLAIIEYFEPPLESIGAIRSSENLPRNSRQPALARACSQLRQDVLPSFYANLVFHFDTHRRTVEYYRRIFTTTPGFDKIHSIAITHGRVRDRIAHKVIPGFCFEVSLAQPYCVYGRCHGVGYFRQWRWLQRELSRTLKAFEMEKGRARNCDVLWRMLDIIRESQIVKCLDWSESDDESEDEFFVNMAGR